MPDGSRPSASPGDQLSRIDRQIFSHPGPNEGPAGAGRRQLFLSQTSANVAVTFSVACISGIARLCTTGPHFSKCFSMLLRAAIDAGRDGFVRERQASGGNDYKFGRHRRRERRISWPRKNHRQARFQPLAGAARRARHSPLHRHRLWIQRFLVAPVTFSRDRYRHESTGLRGHRDNILGQDRRHAYRADGDEMRMDAVRSRLDIHTFLRSTRLVGRDLGGWLERGGPRKAGVYAALCWCGCLMISAIGVRTHQLWMLWVGSGVIGDCAADPRRGSPTP
jgi:hypothetical protein